MAHLSFPDKSTPFTSNYRKQKYFPFCASYFRLVICLLRAFTIYVIHCPSRIQYSETKLYTLIDKGPIDANISMQQYAWRSPNDVMFPVQSYQSESAPNFVMTFPVHQLAIDVAMI